MYGIYVLQPNFYIDKLLDMHDDIGTFKRTNALV